MKVFVAVLCLAVAASASHWGGHGHHIASGSIGVSAHGATIAGPAGSVHTDNGLHGHGAGARLSGPAGDVRTHGGHVALHGPGNGHDDGQWHGDGGAWGHGGHGGHVAIIAPVAHGWGHGGWGHHGGIIGHGLIGLGHGHHGW